MTDIERAFDWNDEIENDSSDFILLSDGDYDFEVSSFDRARHNGSEKLPPCNKAIVYIKIEVPEGEVTLKHNLFLHSKTEGMLCAFFTCIGLRKHGEKLKMNWNKVPGSRGCCRVGQRQWTNDDGKTITMNEIKKFYEPEKPDEKPWAEGKF